MELDSEHKGFLVPAKVLPWYVRLAIRIPFIGEPKPFAHIHGTFYYGAFCPQHGYFLNVVNEVIDDMDIHYCSIRCPNCDYTKSWIDV